MIRESDIERAFVAAVRALGGIAYKFVSPGRRGVPDRLVVLPGGRIKFVELKAPGGRVSKLQAVQFGVLALLGAPVTVLRSKEEVAAWAKHLRSESTRSRSRASS